MDKTRKVDAMNCPFCGSDAVQSRAATENVRVGRKRIDVSNISRSHCKKCGQVFTTPTQHDANLVAIRAAKQRLTPILPREIRLIRATLGLSQDEAQKMFAGGKHAFSKYERGLVVPSLASARLLRLAVSLPGAATRLALDSGVTPRTAWDDLGHQQYASKAFRKVACELKVEHVSAVAPTLPTKHAPPHKTGWFWWPTLRGQVKEVFEAATLPFSSSASEALHLRGLIVTKKGGKYRTLFNEEFDDDSPLVFAQSKSLLGATYLANLTTENEVLDALVASGPIRRREGASRISDKARTRGEKSNV